MVKQESQTSGFKVLATNPKAFHNFFVSEKIEAGLVLTGTEVKSLRAHAPNISDAYVDICPSNGVLEAWLANTHIAPYTHGNIWNHDPMRRRKILLHRKEIEKLHGAVAKKGMTLLATKMYFKKGVAKIELGLGKGKKHHDKRESLKQKSAQRDMERAVKSSRKR